MLDKETFYYFFSSTQRHLWLQKMWDFSQHQAILHWTIIWYFPFQFGLYLPGDTVRPYMLGTQSPSLPLLHFRYQSQALSSFTYASDQLAINQCPPTSPSWVLINFLECTELREILLVFIWFITKDTDKDMHSAQYRGNCAGLPFHLQAAPSRNLHVFIYPGALQTLSFCVFTNIWFHRHDC